MNFNEVLNYYKDNRQDDLYCLLDLLPREEANAIWQHMELIETICTDIVFDVEKAWESRPEPERTNPQDREWRRQYALWVRRDHLKLEKYLFCRLDDVDYMYYVLRFEFKEYLDVC